MRGWKLVLVLDDALTEFWLGTNPGWSEVGRRNGWRILWVDPRNAEKLEAEWPATRRVRLPKNRAATNMPPRVLQALGQPSGPGTVADHIAEITGNETFDEVD